MRISQSRIVLFDRYYHANLSRDEAEELLKNPGRENGSFLVRSSHRFLELVLSGECCNIFRIISWS